jgi:hypothetical protein
LRSWESISWPRNSLHFMNPKVYCHIDKGPRLGPILSQMNPAQLIYYTKTQTDNPWYLCLHVKLTSRKRIVYTILCAVNNSDTPW